jgi:hypothetical protein
MKKIKEGVIFLFCLLPLLSMGQSMRKIKPMVNNKPQTIIDYGYEINENTRVPFRGDLIGAAGSRQSGTNFEVTYNNFSSEQRVAFQYAVNIWANLLQSDVPIRLTATMISLPAGTIGSTAIPTRYANFDNAQKLNTFYVVSLAEKMAGYELNGAEFADISMSFNTDFAFYFGTDGVVPNDKFDFVSIVLHEIGHGLGFIDGTYQDDDSGIGWYNIFGVPMVYDRHIETGDGINLVDTFDTGTTALGDALIGNDLFFDSFSFLSLIQRPKLYAPTAWNSGSSIAHLDENTYPPGHVNSLMSPQFGFTEAIHDPGFAYEMFQDMGWVAMDIDFALFLDSEDSINAKTFTVTVKGDSAVIKDGVYLHYSYNEFGSEVAVNMVPTGATNEYSALIPATGSEEVVSYYIYVDAVGGKNFTSPGEAPEFFWQFVMAKDTIAPEIDHKPTSIGFLNNPVVSMAATVTENIGVGDLMLTYKINSGTSTTIIIPLVTSTTEGFYEGDYQLDWDLGALGIIAGDTVKYKLDIQDLAVNPNITNQPETGFYNIHIVEFNLPAALYENNFNVPSNDFTGSGFVIGPETNFDSDAIHSDHPYRVVDGNDDNDSLTHIYLLKTPIVLSATDATMSFDEVVLVEPGTTGTVYGDDEFWDYVIVEGSSDFGITWLAAADGKDSRDHAEWLARYTSADDGDNNSTALGDKSLYINNEIDLTANGNFIAGDTVLIRFRMYIDPFAHGWGWAIDNLKIQVDDKPPVITQIPPDYMMIGDTLLTLKSKVVDNAELDSVIYEVDFNGVTEITTFPGTANLFTYELNFAPAITATDVLKYRIIAVDKAINPNTSFMPATGFYEIPVAEFGTARTMYVNDFNTTTDDFFGVNFSIRTPADFTNPALVTANPYTDSPIETTEMSYLLKFPIIINQNAAWVQWDEEVLVEPGNDEVAFEVSKDGGVTWFTVFDPYDASAETTWAIIFNNFDSDGNSAGTAQPSLVKRRLFNMLINPLLSGGDEVLVRFRMTVNDNVHGWGWLIDNFEIQGPTTAIEDELTRTIQIYPNPTNKGIVVLSGTLSGSNYQIVVTDVMGKIVLQHEAPILNNTLQTTLNLSSLKNGIYIISVNDNLGVYTSRVIVE